MWSRSAAAVGLLLALVAVGSTQNRQSYSRALPPDKLALDRLNLRTEWTLYLPIDGSRDSIQLIQTLDDQLFVQTRTGLLIAIEARTGRIQWTAALGDGTSSNVYPVAVNGQFVFVMNVTKLYAFYRYAGVTEFVLDLGSVPTAGLAADDSSVYVLLTARTGTAGVQRIAAFDLPNPIVIPEPGKIGTGKSDRGQQVGNPVDDFARRYPGLGVVQPTPAGAVDQGAPSVPPEAPTGGVTGSRTPSLAVVQRLSPPYRMETGQQSPSLATLPSLRQPYHLRDATNKTLQRTPSLGTIPPSVAAALALSDLRPQGISPTLRWEYGLNSRALYPPIQGSFRIWVATDAKRFLALSKLDKSTEVAGVLWERVSANPGQAGTTGYVPLGDGSLVAVNLDAGNLPGGMSVPWRANIGGLNNRPPLVTNDAVFAAGDNSGVVRVNRLTGDVVWRTEGAADRLIAVNKDFAYIRDRQGKLLVYDAVRPTEPSTGHTIPLTGLDLPEFNIPVVNTVTDRVYLAADNGLLVCVRDASAKYAAPIRMAAPVTVGPGPKGGVSGLKEPTPKETMPAKEADMPKDKVEAPPKKP